LKVVKGKLSPSLPFTTERSITSVRKDFDNWNKENALIFHLIKGSSSVSRLYIASYSVITVVMS